MVVLQVIGGGRMGEALVGGLVHGGTVAPGDVLVVEPVEARRRQLAELLPGVGLATEPAEADGTVVAVKPADVPAACRAAAAAGSGRVLSIAAGVSTAALEAALAPGTAVVRAMPSTPASINASATRKT
jgi:pyrroline-5-carboxylate reductase